MKDCLLEVFVGWSKQVTGRDIGIIGGRRCHLPVSRRCSKGETIISEVAYLPLPRKIILILVLSLKSLSCNLFTLQEGQTNAPGRNDSVDYHFVAFVHADGQLYELDGRKRGPVSLKTCEKANFLKEGAAACKDYMAQDPDNINFTVLALTAKMI